MIRALIARVQGLFQGRPWERGELPYGGTYWPPVLKTSSGNEYVTDEYGMPHLINLIAPMPAVKPPKDSEPVAGAIDVPGGWG